MTLIEPSWDEARKFAASLGRHVGSESLPLAEAIGRTLANDAHSLIDLPAYETSAMDGYAVSGVGPWKIIGEIKAGEPFGRELFSGEAVGIATGAVIPDGAFGILRWEDATVSANSVSGVTTERKDFRPKGQEAQFGELLLENGTSLNPAMIGLLAAAGYDSIDVSRKPRTALLLFGDEIQRSGIPYSGLIRDSLGPQLPGWLEKLGCDVVEVTFVSDDLEATIEALKNAAKRADLIVTTGGTADGPRDFLQGSIHALNGVIHISKVAVRPGHPQMLAEVDGVPLIGLPGNPQSAVVALMTLGQPLIDAMIGRNPHALPEVTSDDKFEAQENFTRLVLGTVNNGKFSIGSYLGSAMLRGLAQADGFAVCTNPPTSIRWLGLPT